jgi:hypothetical protein
VKKIAKYHFENKLLTTTKSTKKKLIIVVNSYSKSMNTKNKKGTHLKKKVANKIPKKKLHAKLQKSYKNIANTVEQEQDEKVN